MSTQLNPHRKTAPSLRPIKNQDSASVKALNQNRVKSRTAKKITPEDKKAKEPMQPPKTAASPLQKLIAIESEALRTPDRLSLKHIAVNRPRSLLPLGHILWINRNGKSVSIAAISSQSTFDKTTPFAQWITAYLNRLTHKGALDNALAFSFSNAPAKDPAQNPSGKKAVTHPPKADFDYPFSEAYFAPFSPEPKTGGLLFTRDTPFSESDRLILDRLGQSFGANWAARHGKNKPRSSRRKKCLQIGSLALICLIGCIPVPMTDLAPAEIVADKPFMVTAPFDGVTDDILIPPNRFVKAGTVLARLNDTRFRNEYALAGEEKSVADARLKQAALSAFINVEAKKEIAIAKAEKALAQARESFAKDQLLKTELIAPHDGLAIYSDPKDWTGRPVSTGEAIIEIAEPTRIVLRIQAPLPSGERLRQGMRVRLFLDADPVNPVEATLESASFYAQEQAGGELAFTAFATLDDQKNLPRIGARGVAKLYGQDAPLAFWLLRQPVTALRQLSGF